MSKIDGQITDLRKAAQVYRNLGKYAMEVVLLDAADTICELRDDLQRANAENQKLRELMSVMAYCIQGWRECDGCRVNGGAGIITERAGCSALLDRLRELGMEVPYGD